VKAGGGILDADMTTLGRMIASGFRWWIDELAELVPERLRGRGGAARVWLHFDGHALTERRAGQSAAVAATRATTLPVRIARDLCLIRDLPLPAISARDLERMVLIDADRVMPMPPGAMIVAGRIAATDPATRMITAEIAGLPVDRARTLVAALAAAQVTSSQIGLADDSPRGVDFLSAFRAQGLLAPRSSAAAGWWAIVAFLFALNIGLLVWRDHQSVARLQQIVDGQQPAVLAARTISRRVAASERIAAQSVAARRRAAPLALLGQVSAAIPPGAWVQRLHWDGATVRIAGYKPRTADVLGALRRQPAFADVRNAAADTVGDVPAGQPFDITARWTGVR